MKALRLIATLVTGSMMFAGGILLAMTGPPLVTALGIATAAVGALYTFAGITAERTIRPTAVAAEVVGHQTPARRSTLSLARPTSRT